MNSKGNQEYGIDQRAPNIQYKIYCKKGVSELEDLHPEKQWILFNSNSDWILIILTIIFETIFFYVSLFEDYKLEKLPKPMKGVWTILELGQGKLSRRCSDKKPPSPADHCGWSFASFDVHRLTSAS